MVFTRRICSAELADRSHQKVAEPAELYAIRAVLSLVVSLWLFSAGKMLSPSSATPVKPASDALKRNA